MAQLNNLLVNGQSTFLGGTQIKGTLLDRNGDIGQNQFLKSLGNGGVQWTTITTFSGANDTKDGSEGLVPYPKKGEQNKFLRADATWQIIPLPEEFDGTNSGLVPQPGTTDAGKFLKSDGSWSTVSTADEKVKITRADTPTHSSSNWLIPFMNSTILSNGQSDKVDLQASSNFYIATSSTGGISYVRAPKFQAASFNATSDKRLKENFSPFTSQESILDLPLYKFDFIEGAKNQIGCMAQDLQQICPEIVNEDENGYLSIQESKIVYLLLEEVKKLRIEIDNLSKRN